MAFPKRHSGWSDNAREASKKSRAAHKTFSSNAKKAQALIRKHDPLMDRYLNAETDDMTADRYEGRVNSLSHKIIKTLSKGLPNPGVVSEHHDIVWDRAPGDLSGHKLFTSRHWGQVISGVKDQLKEDS